VINGLILALAFGLLVAQGMLQHALERVMEHLPAYMPGGEWFYPSLVLPLVLYMAVGEFSLARGASLAFVVGYLSDAFSGLPMGLFTFTMVAVFLLARVAGLKLFLHGVVFQVLLTLVAQITGGMLMLGLNVVFERTRLAIGPAMALVTSQAFATALLSPLVFWLVRRVPGVETAKPEES
jgi:rod shape-determining protein MreD